MSPIAFILFITLLLAPMSLAGPIQPRSSPTTVDSVSASAASSSDVPLPVFTFGPTGLPHASAPTMTDAPTSSLILEMDWLS
ncbi:hypothetical protein GSI_03230 [Ganoderma sinense ZZ0214-1]|uniref:Transporter n=1 Tax=Ganoderma sinense ZZ0214-1 TaxID=1077348 RepID=A0A2G8SL15_9APHY|nr:hypothetical protein GSI_03230 [Ganoderma sinense ZZ0214-1]